MYMDAIDWSLAQRIGEMVAGSPPHGGVRAEDVTPLASDYAQRISAYTGLALSGDLPVVETVDRPRWIAANLRTMRPLLDPLTERMAPGTGPLSGAMRTASGALVGAQIGALTGMLSQRVLGQYDIALLEPEVVPRLLLVAPNLAQVAGSLAVDRHELVKWVTIHEITHAVQFTGASWLRGHLAGLIEELMKSMQIKLDGGGLPKPAGLNGAEIRDQLRDLVSRARNGELLRLTIGEERWSLVERMQATMSLIEGHAEHVMDAVGADVLTSLPRLRAAMTSRRETRGLPWRILERLLGLELKLRQYEVGRRFCDAVVREGGPAALAPAWRSAEGLPTGEELETPALWLARTHVPPVTSS
jgi:coenzyme F420 biosynthesis associated uncharacterized protein